MKTKAFFSLAILIAANIFARVTPPFPGWDRIAKVCSDIVIIRCGPPMPPAVGAHVIGAYNSDAEISIVSLLKGANNAASARLKTDYDLQQGKYYLVFGYNNNGIYTSYGESSVIPLGRWFFTNSIAGKTPDVQIQILLKAGLDNLSQQLQETQEEKHKRVSS